MSDKFVWAPGDLHRGDCDILKNEMDALTYELLRRRGAPLPDRFPCSCGASERGRAWRDRQKK